VKTINLLKKLERYPLFTENDIAKIVNKSHKYIRTLLYRLHKQGLINRIEKGKYTLHHDAMIFASYLATPSYLGVWTALRYYNMIRQQPFSVFVVSCIPKKSIKFYNTNIIFIYTKRLFGYKKERYNDFDIFISEREKALVDSLLFKIPLSYISQALDNGEIDFKKLSEYAIKTKNKSLIKRLGYMLESRKGSSFGLKAMDGNYVKLDYLGNSKGKKDTKWKLIINMNFAQRILP